MRRKNGIGPEEISFGSNFRAWWKCKKGHIWQAIVVNRTTNDAGCYICNKGAPTDLRDYPDVLMEFDHRKNKGIDPHALPVGLKVAWRCSADPTHDGWVSGFYRTTKQERCPSCTNKKGSKGNNLKLTQPEFAKQWDKVKNGDLKPDMVTENGTQRKTAKPDPIRREHIRARSAGGFARPARTNGPRKHTADMNAKVTALSALQSSKLKTC